MNNIQKVNISAEIIAEIYSVLRKYGKHGCEGLLLLLGEVSDDEAYVSQVMVPPQRSIKDVYGVGYSINSKTLFDINKNLFESGLRLIAQVHSHPGRAYHSDADDRYCIVTAEGGLSIVVPDFGFNKPNILEWAVYRLQQGVWGKMPTKKVRTFFDAPEAYVVSTKNPLFFWRD